MRYVKTAGRSTESRAVAVNASRYFRRLRCVFNGIFSQSCLFPNRMESSSIIAARLFQVARIAVCLAASTTFCALYTQTDGESGKTATPASTVKVILEVVNNHFTVGRKIPSIYLRLFSDGSAECHAVRFSGHEQENIKTGYVPPKEFDEIKAALNQTGLRIVDGRYDLPWVVLDSWMEWGLKGSDSQLGQDVTISFGPETEHSHPYPEALRNLGCQILKIREKVYGDRTGYYRPACPPQK
jgi:hypothetical protein